MIPPIARSFVAGEVPATAITHVAGLNERNVGGILNLLGEHYEEPADATADADEYVTLVQDIAAADLDACISVKPSQLGLDLGADVFEGHLERIVAAGQEHDVFVWIDMEDHTTTNVTLDAFEHHARATDGDVGVCVQANLERTRSDLDRLAELPGKVRLVKGAYDEPSAIAHTSKKAIDDAFRACIRQAFETFDDGVAVASHDPEMIALAEECHDEYGTPYEVQMLMGVRETAQYELAESRPVYQYVPYGNRWLSYFYRRIRERKGNALFALRAVLTS